MNFDDQFTRGFEKKFADFVEEWNSFPPEKKQDLIRRMQAYLDQMQALMKKPDKTREEEELLQQQIPLFKEHAQKFIDLHLLVSEKNFRDAKVIHEEIKKRAKGGDRAFVEAEKKLDESFRKTLVRKIDEN